MNKFKFIVITSAIVVASATALFSKPAFTVSERSFDFGKVAQKVVVNNTFWIKSTGTDTLRIFDIQPGCGCTRAPIDDSVLAPGDSTRLQVFFKTQRFKGNVVKKPSFRTNVNDEKVELMIKAEPLSKPETMTPILISPFKVDISQFSKKVRRKSSFTIKNLSNQDYNLTLLRISTDKFIVELPEKVLAGETVKGRVVLNESAIEENLEESFTFAINDKLNSHFTLPVKRIYRMKK